jgi:hypothetical protein
MKLRLWISRRQRRPGPVRRHPEIRPARQGVAFSRLQPHRAWPSCAWLAVGFAPRARRKTIDPLLAVAQASARPQARARRNRAGRNRDLAVEHAVPQGRGPAVDRARRGFQLHQIKPATGRARTHPGEPCAHGESRPAHTPYWRPLRLPSAGTGDPAGQLIEPRHPNVRPGRTGPLYCTAITIFPKCPPVAWCA